MTPPSLPEPAAFVALTPRGAAVAERIVQALGRGEVVLSPGNLRETLASLFRQRRPLVCVMAVGIVVRVLGPLTSDKQYDPPVVVVDEAGRWAISLVGGHAGGANELAGEVARAIGAQPVITTASDALGLPAVDLIGRSWGWKLDNREHLATVAAAVVRGERIGVYQDAGRLDWWQPFGDWPASFHALSGWPPDGEWAGLLAISDRTLPPTPTPAVIVRPPTLVAGIGCRRGVPAAEIDDLFLHTCTAHGFAPPSLGLVATVSLKADEPGLREFTQKHGVPLRVLSVEELAAVSNVPTPSERVRQKIGLPGVAEPAALAASGAAKLLVAKQRGARVTLALARREA